MVTAVFSQVTKTINLTTAGTLSSLLTANEKSAVTNLTITGNIDARDVKCMRDEMSKLAVLDISTVTIEEYSGELGTYPYGGDYGKNEMCGYSFYNGNTYKGKTTLTSIKLPTSLTSISSAAFANCSGLTSILIPLNVTLIGSNVFKNCTGLTTINIHANLSYLYDNFNGCINLSTITVDPANVSYSSMTGVLFDKAQTKIIRYPEGKKGSYLIPPTVKEITESAFSNCTELTGSLTIPISLTTLSMWNFYECTGLTSFIVDTTHPNFSTNDGVLFNKYQTQIIAVPAGKTGRYIVPSTVEYFTNYYSCISLSALTIPSTISGDCGFGETFDEGYYPFPKLRLLNVPAKSFYNMELTLPSAESGEGRLAQPTLDSIIVNSGNFIDYGFYAIKYFQNLKFLDLSQTTNTNLPKSALFDLSELEELILPVGLTTLSYKSVAECASLKSINIPASVTEIGMRTFENCRSMKNVTFAPNSQLKTIDNWAFYACHGLKDIVIPNGVTSVGDGAFWGCEYLSDLTLPATVQKINDNGFDGCIGLSKIKVEATIPPVILAKTFNRVNKNTPVYVPDASVSMYKNAFGWKDFFNIKGISTQVQELDEPSFGIRVINKTIEITNAEGETIQMFDIAGRMIFMKSNADNQQIISLQQKGVYLLNIGDFKKKIMID